MSIRNTFHNYVFKNMAFFVIMLIVAISVIIATSYGSSDGQHYRKRLSELQYMNRDFSNDIDDIVLAQFSLVNIISRTSYPDVALDYFMDQQFYDIVAEMKQSEPINMLLYDSDHHLRRGDPALDEVVAEIGAIGKSLFHGDNVIRFTPRYVVYTKKLVRNGGKVGYLVGVKSKAFITNAIEADYLKNTSSAMVLHPKVWVRYPETYDGVVNLDFSYDGKVIHGVNAKSVLIVSIVSIVALLGVSLLFRRSLARPFKDIEKVIEFVAANKEGGFVGRIPADPLFRRITMMLLRMHRERSAHEYEVRRQEVFDKMTVAAAHVAHDMRSPLSVLKGYVDVDEGCDGNEVEEYRGAAKRSVDKLLHMAEDLVDYSKAAKVERSQRHLRGFVDEEVVTETSSRANEKGVTVSCDMEDGIVVAIDGYRVGRVLTNLVNNSIQACSVGGRVALKAYAEDESDLIIEVIDDGAGIVAGDLPRIFDSFFTKGKKGGTGLGLAYCKQVVEAHGGTIYVESEVGRGTKFTIRIPNCVVKDGVAPDGVQSIDEVRDAKVAYEGNLNLILADDDSDMLGDLERRAKGAGATVAYKANAVDEVIDNGKIDYSRINAAIVDYEFRGSEKNGIDLVRHLKSMGVKYVHLCTGHYEDEEVRKAAMDAGATSILKKPLEQDEIGRILG